MRIDDFTDLTQQVGAALHAIDQVGPIEGADQHRGIGQPQLPHDVLLHAGRRRGGIAVQRHARKALSQPLERAILGAEIVAPIADAVSFIDRQERQRHALEKLQSPLGHQPLGRKIQQLQPPGANLLGDAPPLVGRKRAVHAGGRHAAVSQTVHLVLHQRDQR
jgi:hypothetical protein